VIYINCHIHLELGEEVAAEAGSLICGACLLRTYFILTEIKDTYRWISDPEYLAGTREPASHYTKSRPPVSLHAVSLLDKRTMYRRKGDPVSAHRVLKAWRDAVGDMMSGSWQEQFDGNTVPILVAELRSSLGWIAKQPAVVRFARHMACVLHSLKQEVGDLKEENDDD